MASKLWPRVNRGFFIVIICYLCIFRDIISISNIRIFMAHINRRYIDKHWFVFVLRGGLAAIFGVLALFGALTDLGFTVSVIVIFLLIMGIIDATSALYNSTKKQGWGNSVIDALIDVVAALTLLFVMPGNQIAAMVILAIYTCVSGLIDIIHGFINTVDPTDRFIRVLAGVIGAITGFVILNAGSLNDLTFVRFFGAYLLVVGVTSMVYGVHNRSQKVEDHVARKEAAKKGKETRALKSASKKVATKKTAKKK